MTKPLHAGNAARSAVLASTLAANGYTADETILTSSGGFADVYGVAPGAAAAAVKKLTQHLEIVEHGIGVKRYPSCSPNHGYINAMRILKEKYGFTAETVEAIACSPSRSLRCLYPKTDLEAKFSAAFSLVATLIDGEVNLRNCTEAFLRRDDVQALLAKTSYLENTTGSARVVRIKTTSGQVYEQPLLRPKDITDPGEIRRKYADCAVAITGEAQARRIEAAVFDLDKVQDIEEFAALLRL
jgi:2-methylcitrate dehydratase PrpD